MNECKFVHQLVCNTEEKFGCICYAFKDGNTSRTNIWWSICIDNFELYYSNEYKDWTKRWHDKAGGVNLLFCYCNPIEEKLSKLAEEDNLIMNI